jgi:hypothetical protein
MLTDRFGLNLSTTSSRARDAYVEGCDLILAGQPGAAGAPTAQRDGACTGRHGASVWQSGPIVSARIEPPRISRFTHRRPSGLSGHCCENTSRRLASGCDSFAAMHFGVRFDWDVRAAWTRSRIGVLA